MAERETVKDFHTGEVVLRRQFRVVAKPCANCGQPSQHYDAKYGWYICVNCDSDETASEIVREATGCTGIF